MTDKKTANLPMCDREAARLLQIQMQTGNHRKAGDFLLTALFLGAIFVFAILFWILPDRAMSETENRSLAQAPKVTVERILDGKFTADIAEYMADQFPARDFFVNLKALSETALGRGGNNGILFGADETLVTRDDLPSIDNMKTNLSAIAAFSAHCESLGIPVTTAVAGRTADVLDHTLPNYYGSVYSDRLWTTLSTEAEAVGVDFLNLRDPLRARAKAGEYVYYRTDHHWTTLGAYYGYAAIAEAMGDTAAPLSDFSRETVSESFYGTTWSTAGASWIDPDGMEFFRFEGDEAYVTSILDAGNERSFPGFYDTDYLLKKDKYSTFIGGNSALVTVTESDGEDRETLLLFKDSFAHAVVPFLARQYDLVIVDLRYYKQAPAALIDAYGVDAVLFLYNVDSLTASASQRLLMASLG